jgi:amino acid transporter
MTETGSMNTRPEMERSIGLLGATGVGVGAIVGGGILALAGVAFAATGPSAILAFALNGVIAIATALSFAELATRFPEQGGTYAFARKVLSIEAAFTVGWVVWFASIVAATLYAFGFGAFALIAIDALGWVRPPWLTDRVAVVMLGTGAVIAYTLLLLRRAGGGGQWINVGKVVVFGVLIAVGLWKLAGTPSSSIRENLSPFFAAGALGLVQAMGYSFIAFQGFDLIAAVGGEVRDPARTIPRGVLFSLAIALLIYLPLLLVVVTVGVPAGGSVTAMAVEKPEAVVAVAAGNYMGGLGYWLVIVAAILAMLSALGANLLAASRVALAMARDRTLPRGLEFLSPRSGMPTAAILVTATLVIFVLVITPDVASVGASASLVFLVSFSLVHRISILARRRGDRERASFRVPAFPIIPWIGAIACLGLALFQGISVPSAGVVACIWLALGAMLYGSAFARRARTVDAFSQGLDGELVRLRGRSPLVLVPIVNPENAEAMVGVADALAPPVVGRVLLLSVVTPSELGPAGDVPPSLANVQTVLGNALAASWACSLRPQMLTTISADPWAEIHRVAVSQRCESLLLGFSRLTEPSVNSRLERVMGGVTSDVVVLRAPEGWALRDAHRVLVPIAGRGIHNELRARLLGSLYRLGAREITLLRIVRESATEAECAQARRALMRTAHDEAPNATQYLVTKSDDPADAIASHAAESDLVVLGVQRQARQRRAFGKVAVRVAERTPCAIVMISRRVR